MIEKLTQTTEVRTFLVNVRCPNKACEGYLSADGKSRAIDGVHGGTLEYRHACGNCTAGYWLRETFPKVKYEPLTANAKPAPKTEVTT